MSDSVNRQIHRKNSLQDKRRRDYSRTDWHEKAVDPQKEINSICAAHFPRKKESKKESK